jgi:hypothetical protein
MASPAVGVERIVRVMDANGAGEGQDEMTPDEKRRDQLLSAPGAVERDAATRIEVSEHHGVTRVDIAADAEVRPGNPYEPVEDDR